MINYHIEVNNITQNKFPLSITVSKQQLENLDHMRGTIKRSHYIEKLIEDHFEALKKTVDCETSMPINSEAIQA
jgi:hypothetical protein